MVKSKHHNVEEIASPSNKPDGCNEVICSTMSLRKTDELIRKPGRALITKKKVAILKIKIGSRCSEDHIVSHNKQRILSKSMGRVKNILKLTRNAKVLGIYYAQFFNDVHVELCKKFAGNGKRVIAAELDKNYREEPLEPMQKLLYEAGYVTKTLAGCVRYGNPANFTQRIVKSDELIYSGATKDCDAQYSTFFKPSGS
ncbi:MAG: thymidine kinase [Candidatus Marinimicrobia bacterium]|nr:thymidine kinase [Candidatus Neomarinimicrobiota bacterium]